MSEEFRERMVKLYNEWYESLSPQDVYTIHHGVGRDYYPIKERFLRFANLSFDDYLDLTEDDRFGHSLIDEIHQYVTHCLHDRPEKKKNTRKPTLRKPTKLQQVKEEEFEIEFGE